ncbi:MAG TPA: nitroreductase family deazaflavin-dependent oxidoreductase [Acidimicrobiia bacterium]|nr:nitroreductase family deazaflavin-dependent oxidoreductase [Acidimicrobiia bacterium]
MLLSLIDMRTRAIRNWSRAHTILYRATGGRFGRRARGMEYLLLTTTGRRSGKRHTVPLLYLREDPSLAVIASFGGKPRHPDWYWNLRQDPNVDVQVEGERFTATAREADAEERARLWPRAVAVWPGYAVYQKRTDRQIAIVILDRTVDSDK